MFEAAIDLLSGAMIAMRGHARDRDKAMRQCEQMASAIHVLEAAGKVNKRNAIKRIEAALIFEAMHLPMEEDPDAVKALNLLNAIPDMDKNNSAVADASSVPPRGGADPAQEKSKEETNE